jgi:hypothetical protein
MKRERFDHATPAERTSLRLSRRNILRASSAAALAAIWRGEDAVLFGAEKDKNAADGAKAPSANAAPAKKDAKADPADASWKSLFDGKSLKGWKKVDFGGQGEVSVEQGSIVLSMGDAMTGIVRTEPFPKMDYEIALEGKRIDGIDFFCTTTFPVGESFCSLVVGGWAGSVVGLSSIDHMDASENQTTKVLSFKKDQWYRVRIRVTKEKIEAWIDDKKVVDFATKKHKLTTRMECDLCHPLGIATYATRGAVRNLKVRRVKDPDSQPEPADDE